MIAIYARHRARPRRARGPGTTLIVMLAALVACWLGGGRPAMICGLAAAIVGPAAEILIVELDLAEYAPTADSLFGVAPWLPALYFAFGVVVARLTSCSSPGARPRSAGSGAGELGDELGVELARVDPRGGPDQRHLELGGDLDRQLAAVELHRDRARGAAAGRPRPRRRSAPVPEESVSPTPRSKIRARTVEPSTRMNETLVRLGKARVLPSIAGPIAARSSSSTSLADLDHALRVADVDVLEGPLAPARARPSRCRPRALWVVGRGHRGSPDRHRDLVRAGDRRRHLAGLGQDRERVGVGPARRAQVEHRLARPVARELGLRAVGVEDPQLGDVAASGSAASSRMPSEPTPNAVRRSAGSAPR